jgi:hypothetical protein
MISKRKAMAKAERKLAQEKEMERFLKRVGYKGTSPNNSVHEIPDYSSNNYRVTSNTIPGNGSKKNQNIYSGDEISGLVTTHKSNIMPIRKDNPQAAIDAAQMRRN